MTRFNRLYPQYTQRKVLSIHIYLPSHLFLSGSCSCLIMKSMFESLQRPYVYFTQTNPITVMEHTRTFFREDELEKNKHYTL